MDANTLERLMLDRALGELPPDSAELLDAYLANNPLERKRFERMMQTVRDTTRVLADHSPIRLKPFPAEALDESLKTQRRLFFVSRITSLAACLIIGFGVHAFWMSRSSISTAMQKSPQPVLVTANDSAPGIVPTGNHSSDSGFWSMKRIYQRSVERKPETGPRVIWDSPLSTPRLGDST